MASATSGIGTFIGGSSADPATMNPRNGTDTTTLLILAAAALALLLLLRK